MRGTCLCVILSGLALAATGAAEPKPLVNADFETVDRNGKPLGWELPPETGWSIADGQGINGMHALCYDGDLGMTKRGIPLQWVEIDRSKRYLMEAYVRTVGLGGGGASICIQCHDKDGNVFYGKYSHDAIAGNSDGWVRISDVTHAGQFPPAAVKLSLCLFVKGTPRGKAYFDNVRLIPYDEAKAKVAGLISDVYRATAASGKVTFHATLNLTEKEFADRKPVAYCRFIDASGAKAVRKVTALTRTEASFALDVGELAEGTHPVEFALAGADGERIGVAHLDFTRTSEPVKRKVEIDRYNRVIVDGKPFFPLGMYVNHIDNANETNLDIYCQAPFNCILPYALPQSRAHLDLCQRRNLKVIASIYHVWAGTRSAWVKTEDDEKPFLRKVVADIADHPAVLAWYESDELPAAMIPRMAERIRFMAEIDPDHPVYACICLVDEVKDFLPGFDVVGSDPYPIGRSDVKRTPLSLAAEWTRKTRRQSFGCRSMWQIPQAFDWSWYIKTDDPRFPTAEEFRNIGYQCIAEGANGLVWFHFSAMLQRDPKFAEHWASVCATVRELARYQDVFASVPGPVAEETDVTRFSVRTWRKDGSVWVLAVNSTREPLVAKAVLAEPVGVVAETAFGPAPSVRGRELAFDLPALGCALVRMEGR